MTTSGRCPWPGKNELMIRYHDEEWGVPLHDDRKLFEFIVLDTFQAGLSWSAVLNKRENFRRAFDDFDATRIAAYGSDKIKDLQEDAGIIRNKLKINATVGNAAAFLRLQKQHGSFDKYIWQFVNYKPIDNKLKPGGGFPATSKESDAMSLALKKEGFKFAGSTICYAFMQAAGMVNDHLTSCFRHSEVNKK